MPKSIAMLPELVSFVGTELAYLMESSGAPDRDKKTTIESIRRFCTAQGVRLLEVTLGVPGTATTIDVTGTTNVVAIAWGRFPSPTDNRLNVTGIVPEGCYVTVFNANFGILDFSVNGTTLAATPEELDFGPFGRAEMISREEGYVTTISNDSRWLKLKLESAVSAEKERAEAAELAEKERAEAVEEALTTADETLSGLIEDEATARTLADTALSTSISNEASRATSAELAGRTLSKKLVYKQWASIEYISQYRLRVAGPAEQTPVVVGNSGGDMTYSLPIVGFDSVMDDFEIRNQPNFPYVAGILTAAGQKGLAGSWPLTSSGSPSFAASHPILYWSESLEGIYLSVAEGAGTPVLDFWLPTAQEGVDEESIIYIKFTGEVQMRVASANFDKWTTPIRATLLLGQAVALRIRHPAADANWSVDSWITSR